MEYAPGPIVEATCRIEQDAIDAFEEWLARHVDEVLQDPVIAGVEVYQQQDDATGHASRIVHYCFLDEADVPGFLAGREASGNHGVTERFGDAVEVSHRLLHHAPIVDGQLQGLQSCLNCGTTLTGQYCGECGQRAANRLISVWELLRDAFGDLLELDSRLWRTLLPLIARPGQLTRDYLEGRRARYMPPFRTYLVLSIVFFVVAFFDPREELGILFEPEAGTATEDTANDAGDESRRGLDDDGLVVVPPESATGEDQDSSPDFELSFSTADDKDTSCNLDEIDTADWPPWLASRLSRERLAVICDRILADDGRAFVQKLLDNVPAALFLLLPLMALVLKALYPLSKRYYVEHLLFIVHYHAFVFLILSLQVLFARLGALVRIPETAMDITALAVSLYVPVYLYKSLRRVYRQGVVFTLLKFLILLLAYFSGLLVVLALVTLVAAVTI